MPEPSPPRTTNRRPLLLPALVRAWRAPDVLQLGLTNTAPVLLEGVEAADARFLLDLDGRRTHPEVLTHAATLGLTPTRAERLLDLLETARCLGDGSTDARDLAGLGEADRSRLEPDIAALSLLPPSRSMGLDGLGRRRRGHVEVRGAGRLGAAVVGLLAAAGVGTVSVVDDHAVRPCDVAPLGPSPEAVGRPRSDAAVDAARRVAPGLRRDAEGPPDLVVLAATPVIDPATTDPLLSAGTPHLAVTLLETTATVGPLVVPGSGPCLRCLDLHRCDRDPGWPVVAAQVGPPGADPVACDVVLASAAASLATLMALAWLAAAPEAAHSAGEDRPPPCEIGTTYVLRLPDGRPRRRTYAPHPRCGCAWGMTMGR